MAWPPWDTHCIARTPSTRPRGRPRNQLKCDPKDLPTICLYAPNREAIMEQTGLGKDAATVLRAATVKNIEDFAEEQRGRLQELAEQLAKDARASMGNLRPMEKVIALGIVTDKLNQAPKAINQALHLHIKGDAGSALASILGPAAQSVFRRSAQQEKMTELVKIQPAGPVFDAELVTESAGDNAKLTDKRS